MLIIIIIIISNNYFTQIYVAVLKPEAKSQLRRPRRRWVHNIELDLRQIGWGDMDWIVLDQGRGYWRALVKTIMNLRVP
jgi:hypothetical protein